MNVSQAERQLYILSWISDSKLGCTVEELERKLVRVGIRVSRRTIERDMDFVSTGNFYVTEERRDGKVYYLASKFGINNITVTPSELISLHFIRELLKSYSALDIGKTSTKLIEKIIADLPQPDKAYIESLRKLFKVKETYIGIEKCIDEGLIDIVRKSIEFRKCIRIRYCSFNNEEVTERKFDPYVIEIYGGCYHVIGYCHLRDSIRDLRLARIIDVKMLEENYKIPENFYEGYKKARFEKLAGEEEIELILKFAGKAARYVEEYDKVKADALAWQKDGTLLFKRKTTMTPEITKWVLGFGAGVEVLGPGILREEVAEQVREMAERYQK